MKKVVFALYCLALLVSCSVKSNEEKACELIEPKIKSHLIKPDSYEFAELQLDSCFSGSETDPAVFALALEVAKLWKEYKKYSFEAERAESSMAIYAPSYGYQSVRDKQQQKKYKAEMEKAQRKAATAKDNILQLYRDNEKLFKNINDVKHEFIGWMAAFSYRAETAGGMKTMGNALYFLNKDITGVTHHFTDEDLINMRTTDLDDLKYEFEEDLKDLFGNEE